MGQQCQLPLRDLGRALSGLPLLRCKPLGFRWLHPHPMARFLCLLLGHGAHPGVSLLSGGRKSPCEPCSLHVPDLQDDHQVEGGGAWRKTQQHSQHTVQRLQHLQEEQSRCALLLALSLREAGFNSCHLKQNSATLRSQEPALLCLRVCLGCLLPAARKKHAELAGRLSVAQPALTSL